MIGVDKEEELFEECYKELDAYLGNFSADWLEYLRAVADHERTPADDMQESKEAFIRHTLGRAYGRLRGRVANKEQHPGRDSPNELPRHIGDCRPSQAFVWLLVQRLDMEKLEDAL